MIYMRYKPFFLPQVNMPYEDVLKKLDDEGIKYDLQQIDPNELEVSQGVTFSDEVGKVNLSDMNPIWVAGANKVIDGHHRMVKALIDGVLVTAVIMQMDDKDACRLLNKIQDIYEYEQKKSMEEVVAQDQINDINEPNDDGSRFLNIMEDDNMVVQSGETSTNPKRLIGYRRDPIRENSVVGNFFLLQPTEGFQPYEIELDNLLDLGQMGVVLKDGQEPVDILSKIWFPNVNFEKLGEAWGMDVKNLKNKAVATKAMKMGYDGIKHNDTLLQGLK